MADKGGTASKKPKKPRKPSKKVLAVADQIIEGIGSRQQLFGRGMRPRSILNEGYQPDDAFERNMTAAASGDVRTDMGMPIDIRIPTGYRAQVKAALEWFDADPLFHMLIARLWEFGNTRADWVVPAGGDGAGETKAEKAEAKQAAKDQRFWNYWAGHINLDVNHTLPGTDQINLAMFKTQALAGMSPMHWKWGYIEFEDSKYWAPVEMVVHQPLSVIMAPGSNHGDYAAFLKVAESKSPGTEATDTGTAQDLRKKKEYKELRKGNAFVLRFEHCQIDTRMNRTGGQTFQLAQDPGSDDKGAGYPAVPFVSLREAVAERRALAASDLRIIDGIINFILLWKVGTSDQTKEGRPLYPVRPTEYNSNGSVKKKGTIDQAKDYLSNAEMMDVMEIVLPFWIDLQTVTSDVQSLLSSEKYWHSTSEVLHRFGVFVGEDASNPAIGEMNVLGFEAMIANIRETHIARFWEMLAKRVMMHPRNKSLYGKRSPNYHWRPLSTRIAQMRKEAVDLAKTGRFSFESLMRIFGHSPDAEESRIRREVVRGLPEVMNENAPVAFVQSTVDPDGEEKTVKDGDTKRGRPQKPSGKRESGTK